MLNTTQKKLAGIIFRGTEFSAFLVALYNPIETVGSFFGSLDPTETCSTNKNGMGMTERVLAKKWC